MNYKFAALIIASILSVTAIAISETDSSDAAVSKSIGITSTTNTPGSEIVIDFTLDSNTGIWGFYGTVCYDPEILTLKSISQGEILPLVEPILSNPCKIVCENDVLEEVYSTGILFSMVFTISDSADWNSVNNAVWMTCGSSDFFLDLNGVDYPYTGVGGTVTIGYPYHMVTYDVDGGSVPAPANISVQQNSQFAIPTYNGVKAGFRFGGWTNGLAVYEPGTLVTMGKTDIALTAYWVPIPQHTVYYDENGGSQHAPSSRFVYEGDQFTIESYSGTKYGYTFGGWSNGITTYSVGSSMIMGGADVNLVAVWVPIPTHQVSYNLNGGSGTVPESLSVYEGEAFFLATYSGTKSGYTFGGWYDGSFLYSAGSLQVMGVSDINLVAYWVESIEPAYHMVSFDLDGGSGICPESKSVLENSAYTLPYYNGTKEGFTFGGWSDGVAVYAPGTTLLMGMNDITLKANWRAIPSHFVTYNANGGSEVAPATISVYENDTFVVADYSGTLTGFIFGGWSNGVGIYAPGTQITMSGSDIALTAYWIVVRTHTVSFDANGGSEVAPESFIVNENTGFVVPSYGGTLEGFIFGGWSDGRSTYASGTKVFMSASDICLVAVWNPIITHVVSYNINGGTGVAPESLVLKENETFSIASYGGTKEGYSFIGWTDGINSYAPGSLQVMGTSNIQLTAVWSKDPEPESSGSGGGGMCASTIAAIILSMSVIAAIPAIRYFRH